MHKEQLSSLSETFAININESIRLDIGPLRLVIHHEPNEWSMVYQWQYEEEYAEPTITRGVYNDFSDIQDNLHRFAYANHNPQLSIIPKLADRSIVARPRAPFNLIAGQSIWLYVSSPVWLSVCIGEENTLLKEIPVHRPSDTWFGNNTIEGEVAYATRTHARLSLEEGSFSRHRAITPVNLVNDTSGHLLLERISIPAASLNLYYDTQHHLWTSGVTMLREADSNTTSVKIEADAPAQADGAVLLSAPRIETQRNVFVKTIRALFG